MLVEPTKGSSMVYFYVGKKHFYAIKMFFNTIFCKKIVLRSLKIFWWFSEGRTGKIGSPEVYQTSGEPILPVLPSENGQKMGSKKGSKNGQKMAKNGVLI